ncbi:MAG: hypothetical protein ACLP01_05175 [Solirubrobacteraceae bacterium]
MTSIKRHLNPWLALAGVLAGACTMFALPAIASAHWCVTPPLSQPFLSWGDQNEYAAVPGQWYDNFPGWRWTLTGGASVTTTTLQDGSTGEVLDLPSGSQAVSPVMCVNSSYTTVRTMVQDVTGNEGVEAYVSYLGNDGWSAPIDIGNLNSQANSWAPSSPLGLQPGDDWQYAQFTFIPGGQSSEFQIYNVYVDPYSK